MSANRIKSVLARRWPILAACLVVAFLFVTAYYATAVPRYAATAQLFLRAPDVQTSASAYQGDLFARQRMQTYATMIQSEELATTVIDRLASGETPEELAGRVSAAQVPETVLMNVTAVDANPEQAAVIANAYSEEFGRYIGSLENGPASEDGRLIQVVIPAAAAAAVPTLVSPFQVVPIAVILALIAAALLMVMAEKLDKRVRTRSEIEDVAGIPVIGEVPSLSDGAVADLASARLNIESVLRQTTGHSGNGVATLTSWHGGDDTLRLAELLAESFEAHGRPVRVVQFGSEGTPAAEPAADAATEKNGSYSSNGASTTGVTDLRDTPGIVLVAAAGLGDGSSSHVAVRGSDAVFLLVDVNDTRAGDLSRLVATVDMLGKPVGGIIAVGGRPARRDSLADSSIQINS